MNKYILILVSLLFFGCSQPHWIQTSNGLYMYGELPKNKDIIWEGESIGPLASGKADIVILNKDGKFISRDKISTKLGAASDYEYANTTVGLYLGKKENDLPHGFGSLIRNDTLFLGSFKEGILYEGHTNIFYLGKSSNVPCFIGAYKKGKPNGFGIQYTDGKCCYEGGFKNGQKHGLGKEYINEVIAFEGTFKNGLRNGTGKEYIDGAIVYDGEWHKGQRNGEGREFNKHGRLVYVGNWEDGLYDGKGKLYEGGKCIEGKWNKGRMTKSISSSVIEEVENATKIWFSKPDSLNLSLNNKVLENNPIPTSKIEFIEDLNAELKSQISNHFEKRVTKRFNFWHLVRMITQPWFTSDIKRANSAQDYLCNKLEANEVELLINSRVDEFNENNPDNTLNYIKLDPIPDGAIVNTEVALRIFEREAIETTDVLVGIAIDILVCIIVAFIIGFFIGLLIPGLIPFLGIVDLILSIVAILAGLYISIFHTTEISIQMENTITQMLVDNYMQFLDTQNYILQLTGLL